MELAEVRRRISESTPSDWNLIYAPFLYLESWIWWQRPGDEVTHFEAHAHDVRGVFKPDVSIGLAYGLRWEDGDEFHVPWTSPWPEPIHAAYVDVFWNGMLIDRELVLQVSDLSSSAVLPVGKVESVPGDGGVTAWKDYTVMGESVSKWQADLAKVVHCFQHRAEDFDRFMSQAPIAVVTDED